MAGVDTTLLALSGIGLRYNKVISNSGDHMLESYLILLSAKHIREYCGIYMGDYCEC